MCLVYIYFNVYVPNALGLKTSLQIATCIFMRYDGGTIDGVYYKINILNGCVQNCVRLPCEKKIEAHSRSFIYAMAQNNAQAIAKDGGSAGSVPLHIYSSNQRQ